MFAAVAAGCLAIAASVIAAPRQVGLILTGGTVITMDSAHRVLGPGAVAVDGTDIVGVDAPEAIAAQFTARNTIDTKGKIVLPGLINTHGHAPMVLYRGLADDLALMDWLAKYIFPAEARTVSPEMVTIGTRLAALEMIRAGTGRNFHQSLSERPAHHSRRRTTLRVHAGQDRVGRVPRSGSQIPSAAYYASR
jgi:5-methylthioadenosine/S-adenosylhomocysteine deaminase